MGPFAAIAASVLPQIVRHLAGAGGPSQQQGIEQAVTGIVQAVTKETDPDAARQKIASDPNTEAELRVRLSELSSSLDDARQSSGATVDSSALQGLEQRFSDQIGSLSKQVDAARDAQVQAMHQMQEQGEDTATAKSTLDRLASPTSPTVLAAPLLSLVVILGFFGALGFIISGRFDPTTDTSKLQIVNIVIGALTTGFATVLNFWLGSSQGSKNKDLANFSLQHIQALQAGRQQAATPSAAPPTAVAPSQATPIFHATARAPGAAAPLAAPAPAAAVSATPPLAAAPPTAAPPDAAAPAPAAPQVDKEAAFQACVRFVLKNEGGFVDNPNDPGGATNMGITMGTLRAWRGEPVTVDDVRDLSQDEAIKIYQANYWNPLKCDELPLGVDMVVFDFGVNAGIRRSGMTLQQVIGVTEDGIIGPDTLAAVAREDPSDIVGRFGAARLDFYRQLKEWPVFGQGWTNREAESQSEARSLMSGSNAAA